MKKKLIQGLINFVVTIVLFIIAFVIYEGIKSGPKEPPITASQDTILTDEQSDKVLQMSANEVNKTLPMMIDSSLRADNCLTYSGKKIQYRFTYINKSKSQFSDDIFKRVADKAKPKIINAIRTTPNMEFARKIHATFIYSYYDKDGNYLYGITINSNDYK